MRTTSFVSRLRRSALLLAVVGLSASSVALGAPAAEATPDYAPITGSGSSWAYNAIVNWQSNGKKFGWTVNYNPNGSSAGRADFINGGDFAVSDIPFQPHPTDGSAPESPPVGSYAYMPIVAGGTSFMYNLKIGGRRVTNLRLSGENIARIFTGKVSTWNDPAIAKDNPGLKLPGTKVVPVTRADGSGSSAQFSLWMTSQFKSIWASVYPPAGETSQWPSIPGGQAKTGDDGVASYISQDYGDGAIGYVQYSYAKNKGFPVAKMLNKSGYYVEPTAQNVAVSLLQAKIQTSDPSNTATYLTQDLSQVYIDPDSRTYPLSAYSYMILPINRTPQLAASKAATLGAFGKYLLCDGQDAMDDLGYSPLPKNLVQAGFDQLKKSPGANPGTLDVSQCKNPTFSNTSPNKLADTAPKPPACDHEGPLQCSTGTGGATQPTRVSSSAQGNSSTGGSSSTTGGSNSSTGGSSSTTGGSNSTTGGSSSATGGGSSNIDPETGLAVGGSGNSGADVPLAGPVSLNRSSDTGWSGSQTFAILGGAMIVALFFVPAMLVRRLSRRSGS